MTEKTKVEPTPPADEKPKVEKAKVEKAKAPKPDAEARRAKAGNASTRAANAEARRAKPSKEYVREFSLPAASFGGTKEELETYKAHVKREAEALGLRPEKVSAEQKREGDIVHLVLRAE